MNFFQTNRNVEFEKRKVDSGDSSGAQLYVREQEKEDEP